MRRSRAHHDDHEEHVNHEAWVIPYADMLTLLMGLFLVLWAIGNQDLAKMKDFAEGFSSQMGMTQPLDGGGGVLADGVAATPTTTTIVLDQRQLTEARAALDRETQEASARALEQDQLLQAEQVIHDRAVQGGFGDSVTFRREDRGLVVSIVSDDVLFAAGAADLRQDGSVALDALATALSGLPNPISIEGHTDDVPIASGRFPSNWELSTSRASVVLRYLVDRHGMDPARLVAGGYAEQRPLETNTTPEGRARNRRVDIAVLTTVGEAPGAAAPSGSAGAPGTESAEEGP